MKQFIIFLFVLTTGFNSLANTPEDIDQKVLQSFTASFPKAEEVTWHELPTAYVVNFLEYGIRTRIIYQKNGTFLRSTRYYQEQNLPFYVPLKIKQRFPGKKIFGVTEVSTISDTGNLVVEYYLKLEDARFWITVKMDYNGTTSVIEKYRKA